MKYLGRDILVSKDKGLSYSTESGKTMLWDEAKAYRCGLQQILSVTLNSELKAANKVMFTLEKGEFAVQEIYGEMHGENTVHVQMWNDGVLKVNQTVVNSGMQVQEHGVDWAALNSCLASLGINWAVLAVISVVCAAVCAGTAGIGCVFCISAAAGWTGGSISACVQRAWR